MSSSQAADINLPDGWIVCNSKSKDGRKYYFNKKTGKSSWTKPENEPIPTKNAHHHKEIEKYVKEGEGSKKSMKRKSDGSSAPEQSLCNKKRKEETKTPEKHKQDEPPKNKKTPYKITKKQKYFPNKSINSLNSALNSTLGSVKSRYSYSPAKSNTSISSNESPKRTPTKNLANNRLAQLRAELAESLLKEEKNNPTTEQKIPKEKCPQECPTQSDSNSLQSSPSPSQFFAANKILSSMKAQLPDKYSIKKPKDTFADIEQGINQSDHPFLKPPGTPPQFSEASKLVLAIKSKLSYKGSKEPVQMFMSAKERLEQVRARVSESSAEQCETDTNEAMEVDFKETKTVPECSMNTARAPPNPCKKDSQSKTDDVILVVDTNIFIHKLDLIKNIMNSHVQGYSKAPTLLVPWRVINELDRLKDNSNGYTAISKRARPAMDYLYKCLPVNNRIKVQPLREANSHIYPCESPDDEILNCCLQQAERGHSVILLSNDKNLCSKALANGIPHKQLEELSVQPRPSPAAPPHAHENIVKHIYTLLANILENEMRAKYDNLWLHVLFKAPPWTLADVLQCLLKHWIAVFNEVFPRIEHVIVEMKTALSIIESKVKKTLTQSEVANFKELCLEVAKRCQIIPEYMELAKATVARLESASETEEPEGSPVASARGRDDATTSPITSATGTDDATTSPVASTREMDDAMSSPVDSARGTDDDATSPVPSASGMEDTNGERFIIDALEKIWVILSSYCAKVASCLDIPHNIEDGIAGVEPIENLIDKLQLFGGQITALADAMERMLQIDEATEERTKLALSKMESAIQDSLNTIGVDTDLITETNLRIFGSKCRNMLQEAYTKFSELIQVLELCRDRLSIPSE